MKILVLGSDGLIGKPLTDYLRRLNNDVVEFDNYSNPVADLRITSILDDLLPVIDFVFFLAFDVGGSGYLKTYQDSYRFISNNIKIMNNTFDSLRKHNKAFIFTSSQMSEMNHSSYGILKHIGEKYAYCLNGKIVKLWNVYGPEYNPEKYHVITDFILMAKNRNRIDMRTSGEEMRQFLYVEDCCKCFHTIMEKFGEIESNKLDVSNFEWTNIKNVAEIIASNFNDCPVYPGNEIDDVQRSLLQEPGRDILKYWQPETSLEVGIKNIILHETW
jgi:nucleoside-diphosphate-sugar epimerase